VNAEQAPKQATQEPNRLESREADADGTASEQFHRSCRSSGDGK